MSLKPLNELVSLRGRKALVIGAASGIGSSTAERFAEAGAELVLVDVNEVGLTEVADDLVKRFGAKITWKRVEQEESNRRTIE
ncbi:MAG: SDR family oxidoreductase [Candidatus Caldarchaeum sp.]|nr:SDR family oxidoreductase [Candidatus Caldarchaeum sp.]